MTSADCRTNGRINSPAPNLSPTSFMAGSRTLLRRSTGSRLRNAASSFASIPSFLRRKMALWIWTSTGASIILRRRRVPGRGGPGVPLEMLDQSLQRIGSPVENQIVAKLSFASVELRIRPDLFGVNQSHIEPGFDAVVEHHGIQRGPRSRLEPETHVTHAERREDARDPRLDELDPLDRFDGRIEEFTVAGRQRERQRIEDQRSRRNPVFADDDLVNPPGDLELALCRLRHPDLVDRQSDERRPEFADERDDGVDLPPPALQIDRIYDCAARIDLQRRFDDRRFRRVYHQRRFDGLCQFLDDRRHLRRLIATFGERRADVENVRAGLDLFPSDEDDLVVVLFEEQALDAA